MRARIQSTNASRTDHHDHHHNDHQDHTQDDDDDCDWDESKRTLTAWSIATKQRVKRTYGRRSSVPMQPTVPIKMQQSITSSTSSSSLNADNSVPSLSLSKSLNCTNTTANTSTTNSQSSANTTTQSRSYGRKRLMKQQHQQQDQNISIGSSAHTMERTTSESTSTTSKSQSLKSIHCNSINEENLHPNLKESYNQSQSYIQSYNYSNSFQLSHQDSLSFSTNSGACFSSICRRQSSSSSFFDDNNTNYTTNSTTTTSIFDADPLLSNSIHHHPLSTPSRSVSSSSRKRGVCESPLYHCDDLSSSGGGLSVSNAHQSTSSFGSRRARSRIFSPESTKKIMQQAAARAAAAAVSGGWMARNRNGGSGSGSNCSDNSNASANASANGDGNGDNDNEERVKVKDQKDMTSIRKKNESFHESESEMEIEGLEDNENSFFQNTSCEMSHTELEDLHKNEPPSSLFHDSHPPSRKKKPLLPLPMMPRRMSSVGDVPFEEAIFAPVENSRKDHDIHHHNNNNNSDNKDNNNNYNPNTSFIKNNIFDTMSSYEDLKFLVKELRRWSGGKLHASFGGLSKNCTVVPPNAWPSARRSAFVEWTTIQLGFSHRCCGGGVNYLQIGASKAKELQRDLEKSLLEYKEKSKKQKSKTAQTFSKKKLDTINYQTPSLPMSSIKISRIEYTPTPMSVEKAVQMLEYQKEDSDNDVEDLAGNLKALNIKQHLSTIENDNKSPDCGATPLARMVTLPDEMPSSNVVRPARLSHDNSVMDTTDFVSQMHGISPQFNNTNRVRRQALILPTRQFTGPSTSLQMFSPSLPVITAALSFDQVQTPGVSRLTNRRWGSRPIPGKDWGQSEQCDSKVIGVLMLRLDEACSSCMGNFGYDSSTKTETQFVRPGMSGVKADFKSLGIEFEADQSPQVLGLLVDSNEVDSEIDSNISTSDDGVSLKKNIQSSPDENQEPSQREIFIPEKLYKRRAKSFAKRSRMSICSSAMESRSKPFRPSVLQSKTAFAYEIDVYPCRQSTGGPSPIKRQREKSLAIHNEDASHLILSNSAKLQPIFSFLNEWELQCTASLVCSTWADAATEALASLMLVSVGCSIGDVDGGSDDDSTDSDSVSIDEVHQPCSIAASMQRPWDYLIDRFPWGAFLSEGTFKRVFRVWNSAVKAEEAVSIMDVNRIDDKNIVGNELAVSAMLSSLARRHVCPNFVKMRGVFTSTYEPPKSLWGCSENKQPRGSHYDASSSRSHRRPREPRKDRTGKFQYIRMELCKYGDVEEFIKKQPNLTIDPEEGRCLLFQMAYALHVAGDRFGLKHYDVKLLNFFLHSANDSNVSEDKHPFTVLRYGLGSHVFNLRMPTSRALLAKLADFGTANTRPESNGQPVMLNNFTTLENTPPDFMILGDAALQGYGHDCFGLGLCMLHLFTGDAPYEEITESVKCPPNLKKKLKRVWEGSNNRSSNGYTVIQSVLTLDLWEDEEGNVEGEVDDTLYDTFYRYLVLFGIPEVKFQWKQGCKVWNAISVCLEGFTEKSPTKIRRPRRNNCNKEKGGIKTVGSDCHQFHADCEEFSIRYGKDSRIARARENLERMDGGMDLLFSLVAFDPNKRASALDVMNSTFMATLREEAGNKSMKDDDKVYSYMSYFAVREED